MTTHFLQSKEWEGFQKSVGREVFRIDGMLITRLSLPFGKSYLYVAGIIGTQGLQSNFAPRKGETSSTPLLYGSNDSPLKSQNWIEVLDRRRDNIFLKIEPMVSDKGLVVGLLKAGFQKSKKEIQPQNTSILDISTDEDKLLSAMHEKTRYNIRLAQKKRLEIKNYEKVSIEVFEKFWQVLQKTSGRDKFSSHTKEYYKKLLELPSTRLFVAKHKRGIVAANIILFHEDRAIYLHGASDHEYRSLMAPYILHWEIIKYAKENGFNEYDLWGIDEKKWPGVTRFKRGFGGREVAYSGSYDHVFQPLWYKVYKFRSFLRNL